MTKKLNLGDLDRQFVATTDTYELYVGENNNGGDIVFTIGRTGSHEHEKVTRKYSRRLKRVRRNSDKHKKILIDIAASSLLLGWSGLIENDGKEVPCTLETRTQIMTDYKELFTLVVGTAADTSLFRDEEQEEETEKN